MRLRLGPALFPALKPSKSTSSSTVPPDDVSALAASLLDRTGSIFYDTPTQTPTHLLDATFASFLPPSPLSAFRAPTSTSPHLPTTPVTAGQHEPHDFSSPTLPNPLHEPSLLPLRPGHHLVYFPPFRPPALNLSDGTDPTFAPSPAFPHRRWAGGRIVFHPPARPGQPACRVRPAGVRGVGLERATRARAIGPPGRETIFVTLERRLSGCAWDHEAGAWTDSIGMRHPQLVERELCGQQIANPALVEERTLAFLRPGRRKEEGQEQELEEERKVLKPAVEPDVEWRLTPTARLLFRFSALTFNDHLIHLDSKAAAAEFGRDQRQGEGLLVHGPLTVVLMLEVLGRHLHAVKAKEGRDWRPETEFAEIEYRNVAPLYAGEEIRICAKRKEGTWLVWIEGPDGGYAVKGEVSMA